MTQRGQTAIFLLLLVVLVGFGGVIYFAMDQGSKVQVQSSSGLLNFNLDATASPVPVGNKGITSWKTVKLEVPKMGGYWEYEREINNGVVRVFEQILSTFKFLK
ncbi:hypothetical protein M1437_00395 [Patescibacteria group bacterium]|nr:hypothetical protein [Patescibacteria group bacterium]